MSGAVVAIGYILLVPSILGILFSLLILGAARDVQNTSTETSRDRATSKLRKAGISEPVIRKLVDDERLTEMDKAAFTVRQAIAVEEVQTSMNASSVGTGIGIGVAGGVAIFFGIASFVGGLMGWLLIMKKKVLQCNNCSAVIAAS